MQKNLIWLAGILVFQILFAAGLFWKDAYTAQDKGKNILFSFDQEKINRVEISDGSNTTILSKPDQKWVLPDLQQLPVNENKLLTFLEKLTQLNPGWPVATTKESYPRFEVANNKFQRKIKILKNEELIEEFFVGTSPSFRRGHIRLAKDDAIYSVTLNSYELPVDNTQWLDTSLLSVKDITTIKGKDFILSKSEDKWSIAQLEESITTDNRIHELDETKVNNLVSTLTSLNVLGIAKEDGLVNESSFKSIDVTGSSSWRYELLEKNEKYYIRRNDIAKLFTISKPNYELLANIMLSQLTKESSGKESESET